MGPSSRAGTGGKALSPVILRGGLEGVFWNLAHSARQPSLLPAAALMRWQLLAASGLCLPFGTRLEEA